MKLWIIAFLLLIKIAANAQQLPNSSFESWSLRDEYIEPDGWISTNAYAYFGAVETCYPFEDAHSGKWAAKLETRIDPTTKDTLKAILAIGNDYENLGIAFTQRPTALKLYYQHNLKDTALGAVFLTKWNTQTNKRDTIATAFHFFTDSTNAYKLLTMPFTYTQPIQPDSCIAVFLSTLKPKPNPHNFLLIDDLELTGLVNVSVGELPATKAVKVYPNPVSKVLTIETKKSVKTVTVFDLQGKKVLQATATTIDVTALENTYYFLFIAFENGDTYTTRFLKQ